MLETDFICFLLTTWIARDLNWTGTLAWRF